MQSILEIIVNHTFQLIICWAVMFFIGLVLFRNTFVSLLDPIVYQMLLAISPGMAGVFIISIYTESYTGSSTKYILLYLSTFIFIYFHNLPFKKRPLQRHEFIIQEPEGWQILIITLAAIINILNIVINGNFEDKDPSLRFTNTTSPLINYLSIALTFYTAIFFSFTRSSRVMRLSAAFILITTIVQMQAGASKSFFISFLLIYFNWNFSRNRLNTSDIIKSISNYKIKKSLLNFLAMSILLIAPGVVYLLIYGIINIEDILVRFLLSLDSPAIFIASSEIGINVSSKITGFFTFTEVWVKPFLKNIVGLKYEFENISQYLAYEVTGYRANNYEETSWQPNNNILIDFIVIHGWLSIPLSAMFGYAFGKIHYFNKNRKNISRWTLPLFILTIITPFYAFTDAQSFFTSAILGSIFIYILNIIFLVADNKYIKHHKLPQKEGPKSRAFN